MNMVRTHCLNVLGLVMKMHSTGSVETTTSIEQEVSKIIKARLSNTSPVSIDKLAL